MSVSTLVQSSKDPRDAQLVIRQVTPEIITFSVPFSRFSLVPIGGRSTAVRLSNSDVFIYVSTPPTQATLNALKSLGGEVKYLVTPDGEHGMNIEGFTKEFPEAKAIGVAPFKSKKPDIKWAGLFGDGGNDLKYGFEPEISLHEVSAHANHELVAIHHPSGTLMQADMVFNLPPTEQYSRAGGLPTLLKLFGNGKSLSPGGGTHESMAKTIVKDKEELAPIQAAQWDRMIPCHGDVIESGGKTAWDKVWAKYA